MRVGISLENAVDLFILFDIDQNGQIDHSEFLRQVFPEEYVQDKALPKKSGVVETLYVMLLAVVHIKVICSKLLYSLY